MGGLHLASAGHESAWSDLNRCIRLPRPEPFSSLIGRQPGVDPRTRRCVEIEQGQAFPHADLLDCSATESGRRAPSGDQSRHPQSALIGARTRTSALAEQQATATSWAMFCPARLLRRNMTDQSVKDQGAPGGTRTSVGRVVSK